MLIPNPKSDESVILVDHVRVYSVLTNFAEKAVPLMGRLRALHEEIERRAKVINTSLERFVPPKKYVQERWKEVGTTDTKFTHSNSAMPDVVIDYDAVIEAYATLYSNQVAYNAVYKHQKPNFPICLAFIVNGLQSDLDIARMAVGPYVMAKASAKQISSMEDGSSLAELQLYEARATEWLARADAFDEEAQYQALVADKQAWLADKQREKAEKEKPYKPVPSPVRPIIDGKIPLWFIPLAIVVVILLIIWAKATF